MVVRYPVSELEDLATEAEVNPLPYVRLTGPQTAFASTSDRFLLWRGGNQLGKSHSLAFDIVHSARGTHPYRTVPKGPTKWLVLSESWTQMDPLCEKIWAMLPKNEIDPRIRYERGGGFRGFKEPRIVFTSGPGAGSVIVFATYAQGSGRIAGGSFHGAFLDEPCPESVLGEVLPRISRYHGTLRITMTPTPECPPQQYMREYVEKGIFRELQTSLNAKNITVLGGLVEAPWKSQAQLEQDLAAYLDVERGMREHGDWDPVVAGRWLSAFSEDLVTRNEPTGRHWVAIGIDHGARAGRQACQLVTCSEDGEEVWFLDEVHSDGTTSTAEDARAILDMLDRHPWIGGWTGVDYWMGDRSTGGDFYGNSKSNSDLLAAFAKLLKIPQYDLRAKGLRLETPYKRKGSVFRGLRMMNGLFKEKQARISPRCKRLLESIKGWDGKVDDDKKDAIDAARYAMEKLVDKNVLNPKIPTSARIY